MRTTHDAALVRFAANVGGLVRRIETLETAATRDRTKAAELRDTPVRPDSKKSVSNGAAAVQQSQLLLDRADERDAETERLRRSLIALLDGPVSNAISAAANGKRKKLIEVIAKRLRPFESEIDRARALAAETNACVALAGMASCPWRGWGGLHDDPVRTAKLVRKIMASLVGGP